MHLMREMVTQMKQAIFEHISLTQLEYQEVWSIIVLLIYILLYMYI